jgi:hypothetical protein
MSESEVANENKISDVRLGKLPAKTGRHALLLANYLTPEALETAPPTRYDFWAKREPFKPRVFGNDTYGDCTIASQGVFALHMERIETRATPDIRDQAVIDAYFAMTARLYGGGDTGAYEEDALNNFRNKDTTFRDAKGRPITISAYTKINHFDPTALKRAIYITAAKGIKVCFNLPLGWANELQAGNLDWTIPAGETLTGDWMPGSWGGHSTYAYGYDQRSLFIDTWGLKVKVSWEGVAAYCDEAHSIIDSLDDWRKKKVSALIDLPGIAADVNAVSDIKVRV